MSAHTSSNTRHFRTLLLTAGFLVALTLTAPAAWAIYTIAPSGSSNLIVNPSFEDGSMAPWIIGANYCGTFGDSPCLPWQLTNDNANGGDYSLEDIGDTEVLQYFTPVLGAEVTDISFFAEQDPAEVFAVELFYSTGSTTIIPIFPSNTDWTYYNVTSMVDPSRMLDGIGFVNYSSLSGNGPMWLDDVLVDPPTPAIPTAEPGSLLLLTFGILSLVSLSPRRWHPRTLSSNSALHALCSLKS